MRPERPESLAAATIRQHIEVILRQMMLVEPEHIAAARLPVSLSHCGPS